MDVDLGARHSSTLNGVLLPLGKQPLVTVVLDAVAAATPAWQAATWLLCELVSRGLGQDQVRPKVANGVPLLVE